MRVVRKVALAMLMATVSAAGQAATYLVELKGTVTSQVNPGTDPNISVGDTVVMKGRFTDERIFDNGVNRYAVVYGLPIHSNHYWNVSLNGLTWKASDEILDGFPLDFDPFGRPLSLPYFEILPGGKIGAPQGWLVPVDGRKLPLFDLAPGEIRTNDFSADSFYETPGYNVTWDLAGAKLMQVPEPSVWAMTIVGFGMLGAASRKRARTLRTAHC